jgi:hypothetical protein
LSITNAVRGAFAASTAALAVSLYFAIRQPRRLSGSDQVPVVIGSFDEIRSDRSRRREQHLWDRPPGPHDPRFGCPAATPSRRSGA